ncbi:2'-5' RNA ligase family protein [Pedobacter gandavensis]|uniref:2'-5' RNA ligase family protein n=1 Tax=Pedobacter gandavensis TaxID=2679963 RepID=UPI003977E0B9
MHCLTQARNFKPFTQHLNNYLGFQNTKAVYISALKNRQIEDFYEKIKILTKAFSKDTYTTLNPHLTIAYRDLSESLYLEIMSYYKKRSFKATFEVNHFRLLKHDGRHWDTTVYLDQNN